MVCYILKKIIAYSIWYKKSKEKRFLEMNTGDIYTIHDYLAEQKQAQK